MNTKKRQVTSQSNFFRADEIKELDNNDEMYVSLSPCPVSSWFGSIKFIPYCLQVTQGNKLVNSMSTRPTKPRWGNWVRSENFVQWFMIPDSNKVCWNWVNFLTFSHQGANYTLFSLWSWFWNLTLNEWQLAGLVSTAVKSVETNRQNKDHFFRITNIFYCKKWNHWSHCQV